MKKLFSTIMCIAVAASFAFAQTPAAGGAQKAATVITGVTIHVGNGTVIENGAIAFDKGLITYVGSSSAVPSGSGKVVNAAGKHVYPGFILANSQVGLSEVSSVRATVDQGETGTVNPNIRSIISYNADSEMIPTFRFNGILAAQTTPVGGRVSGQSSIVSMDGWNWEDAAIKMDDGIHLNWPRRMSRRWDWSTSTVKTEANKNYEQDVSDLAGHFAAAVSHQALNVKEANLKMNAMQGLFDGSKALYIHVGLAKEIVESVNFAKKMGVQRVVVVGGGQAAMVAAFLKKEEVPVILGNLHTRPNRAEDPHDLPFRTPSILHEAGVKVVLSHNGMLGRARNLPFYAGTAAAHGLSKEEALKTISLNAAEVLGIADQLGSLEVGKRAHLFVSEGDALDMRGNRISHVFIDGSASELEDVLQYRLYKKYSEKYGHEMR